MRVFEFSRTTERFACLSLLLQTPLFLSQSWRTRGFILRILDYNLQNCEYKEHAGLQKLRILFQIAVDFLKKLMEEENQ